MKVLKTSINCDRVEGCSIKLVQDKRSNKQTDEYPVAVCFTMDRKRYYHKLPELGRCSEQYFNDVCSVSSVRSALRPVRQEWDRILSSYREKIVKLSKTQELSIDLIKLSLSGDTDDETYTDVSFIGVWKGIIESLKKEDRPGTAENYQWALNSFEKLVGNVKGFKVGKNVIEKWNEAMKNGIMIDGKLVGKIADATRGMYLRTCRLVWNECINQGYLPKEKYPFSNKDRTLISIPRGKHRQQSYLNVEEMTELYRVFTEKRYPESWSKAYTERAHESLGLFLAQYLCNGFNLADAGRLQYNNTYFAEGGKAFEFLRKKTSARSNGMSQVIVPIIEPLQVILDEIAAKPKKNDYVFPQIFGGIEDEAIRRKLTIQENSNIKDRVNRICQEVLHWDKLPSGTWARHSFATNLKLAGVEELYISESMGHSLGNDITARYQDQYPLEIRFRYNAKLLNLNPPTGDDDDIDNMSMEQLKAKLKEMMGKK